MSVVTGGSALNGDTNIFGLNLMGPLNNVDFGFAISEPPVLTRSFDEANTLTITCDDHNRKITRGNFLTKDSTLTVDALRFMPVGQDKTGHFVMFTFEDAVANKLRAHTNVMKWNAGAVSIQDVAREVCDSAGVMLMTDPADRGKVQNALEKKDDTNSWEFLRKEAQSRGWRCFSDGWRILMGSDDWLMSLNEPVTLTEPRPGERQNSNPVHNINLQMDIATPAHAATLTVDAQRWALPPGRGVELRDMGWGDGRWIVTKFERELTKLTATVELVRRVEPLPEPVKEDTGAEGESGESGFDTLATENGGSGSTAGGGNGTQRDKMVDIAISLAKSSKGYRWGAKGPTYYDCSGFVAAVTAKAGKQLAGSSKGQKATCAAQKKLISVSQGLNTRGAILFRMSGDPTHVAISLGNGSTVEARGSAAGVGVFGGAKSRTWTHAALWI